MFCLKWLVVISLAYSPSILGSALSDSFGNSPDNTYINLSIQYRSVGKTVGYSPNLPDGGQAEPVRRTRFNERLAEISWSNGHALSVRGVISERRFTSLRDNFEFNGTGLGVRYRFKSGSRGVTALTFDFHSNRSDKIDKNSFTTVGNTVIKSMAVHHPSDSLWGIGLAREVLLDGATRLEVYGGVGQTDSKHSGISGQLDRGNCSYRFDFNAQGGTVSQIDQCGSVRALTRTYPSDFSVEQDFGVSPVLDMRNKSVFFRVGGSVRKRYNKWTLSSSYNFQRYSRSGLDDRILDAGGGVHDTSHALSAGVAYQYDRKLSFDAEALYHKHRYLDQVPVLYTRVTSHRFDKPAIFLSLAVNYRFSL